MISFFIKEIGTNNIKKVDEEGDGEEFDEGADDDDGFDEGADDDDEFDEGDDGDDNEEDEASEKPKKKLKPNWNNIIWIC